ncbi:MAG: choice-of-anchor G family protein, partial [Actinobacteria bacterium]|nr:choice-of-anchor G family protein [Actinomycetota bacterium]
MTASDSRNHRDGSPVASRSRTRWIPFVATGTAAVVAACAIASAGGGAAGAATAPQAQSAGNFINATLGGNAIDQIAKLAYAQAVAPGSNGVQNPLNVTALNAINLPLTGDLVLPRLLGIDLGAVNQVANANVNGSSYGGSGAVSNSGGVSVGGTGGPTSMASIDLNASTIAGNSGIAVPGGGTADALGEVKATIGAVAALAKTPVGYGKAASTTYDIASLNLTVDSPLLGSLLGNVLKTLTSVLGQIVTTLTSGLKGLVGLPADCSLVSPSAITQPISLEKGAITIDPSTASISISLDKLLGVLGLNINSLPANTDLISYLLAYLADPKGLAAGLEGVVNGLLDPLEAQFTACTAALNAIPILGPVITNLLSTLTSGQTTVESTISGLVADIVGSAGNPLAPLASILEKLIDIGVNVQPNGAAGPSGAAYTDPLEANVKQGAPVVSGQTVVRAIEVNVAAMGGSALPGLSSLPSLGGLGLADASARSLTGKLAGTGFVQAAPGSGTGILTLALANAAAGPSAAAPTPPASSSNPPATSVPPTGIPTGVPAGQALHHG